MNFGSQVFLNDIYRQYVRRDADERHYMKVGKAAMYAIVGLAVVVAFSFENVIDIAVFMLGLSSTELTANWAQWWWWRFNGKARLAASFGGPLIFLLNWFIVFEHFIILEDPAYVVILTSIGLTAVLWFLVARFTRPDPEEVLVAFYKKARPFGWWGPIPAKAGLQPKPVAAIAKGFGTAALGSAAVSAAVIALANSYVAKWDVTAAAAAVYLL
jgi:Na+/proline symporter